MTAARTRDNALEVLKEALPKVRKGIEEETVKRCLSPKLVEDIFTQAWNHQFDDNRSDFRGLIRDLVQEALEATTDGNANDS